MPPRRPLQVYFVALGLLVVVAGVATAAYAFVQSNGDAQQSSTADAGYGASKAAVRIDAGLQVIDATNKALTANPASLQLIFDKPSGCSLNYAPLGAFDTGRVEIIRLNGSVVCSSKGPVAGTAYAGQPWLQGAAPAVVAPATDPLTGHQVAVITHPIGNIGLVAWFIDLAPIGPKLASEYGTGVDQLEFLVVTADGKSIVSRSIDSAKWSGATLAGTRFGGSTDVTGTARWYARPTVASTGWKVYVGADEAFALAAAARLQQRQLAIIAGGVLLTLLAFVIVYRAVARPIDSLSRAVQSSTDLDSRVPVGGPLQVAVLGESINGLLASLQREVAGRETAEETYARLFSGSPLPVIAFDPARGHIVRVNDAGVRALGYSREELIAMDARSLSAPRDDEERQTLERVRAAKGPTVRLGPLTLRKKDGTDMRAMVSGYDIDEDGVAIRIQIIEDVTEKEKIERQLEQSQRLETLGQLAGGVAHDFNNLLTVILNVTESMQSRTSDAESTRDLERVDKAAQSAKRLTRQLLAFARRDIVPQSVLNLSDQVADLKDLLGRTIGSHIVMTADLPPGLWPVLMDRGQLEQIVINLVVNARDAMPRGGNLDLSLENFAVDRDYAAGRPGLEAGRYVRMQISDSGTGMDRATLDHLFEPFFTTKPVGQGTGMGLATVYGIVKQLRGHVSVYSEVGHGTTVTVLLPATDQEVVKDEAPVAPVHHGAATGTVLAVEDYADLRELFVEILKGAGYDVLTAPDGEAALKIARERAGQIDLLLTDIVMPNMLGTDLARQLKVEQPNLRVLFMSGHAQPVAFASADLPAGATLLQKPFLEGELLDKVREAMSTPAAGLPA